MNKYENPYLLLHFKQGINFRRRLHLQSVGAIPTPRKVIEQAIAIVGIAPLAVLFCFACSSETPSSRICDKRFFSLRTLPKGLRIIVPGVLTLN